ncbi:hypothetical protein [Solimonas marina]|uniref:Uncharacterized protein n=1 Tax=Solimonas marina TaxID=2714601 RepID=A0A970B8J5_9GAMM|nr:hypothetical protein [Solimonas marina]NKF24815.1 hypothetical protein [Solimonas marina]
MDLSSITGEVDFASATLGVLAIFASVAVVFVAFVGGRYLLAAIRGDDWYSEQAQDMDDEYDYQMRRDEQLRDEMREFGDAGFEHPDDFLEWDAERSEWVDRSADE